MRKIILLILFLPVLSLGQTPPLRQRSSIGDFQYIDSTTGDSTTIDVTDSVFTIEAYAFRIDSVTTTQRDALTAVNGMGVYNHTQNQYQAYANGEWINLGAGAGGGISNVAEDLTPQLGGDLDANAFDIQFDDADGIHDSNDNEQLIFQLTASAVNFVEITNAATGNEPLIAAAGSDTDVSLTLDGQGAGTVRIISSDLIVSNGNVGIGTVTPQEELHVVGEIFLDHTATAADEHALEIDVDAAGFGDIKGLEIEYDTGAISTGEIAAAILIDINEIDAVGGDVIGLEILSTDGGADNVIGIKVGAEIDPLLQDSGSFANPTLGTNNTNTTNVPDMVDGSTGTNTTIFAADDDFIIIGANAAFTEIEFVIETGFGNPGIAPVFAFSTSGTNQFTNFTPTDGTDGFKNAGAFVVAWDVDEVPGHVADDVTGDFDIRITRTANPSGSVSLFYAKTAATRTFEIDKSGNVRFLTYIFEGATDDANEHTLNVINPTADRLFNFPDDQLVAGDVLVASDASDLEYLNLANNELLFGDGAGIPTAAVLSGDVTNALGVITIAAAAVDNSMHANMAQNTIKMRVASGSGDPEDIDISAGLALVTAVSGDFIVIEDATDGGLKRADAGDFLGGGVTYDAIGDAAGNGSIGMGSTEQIWVSSQTDGDVTMFTLDINQVDDADATDDLIAWSIDATSESGDAGDTFTLMRLLYENGTANTILDRALLIDNAETTASTMVNAIEITSSGVNGGVTNALNLSAANITNWADIGANDLITSAATISSVEIDRLDGLANTIVTDNTAVTSVDGTALTITAGALGVTANGIGPTQVDETAVYTWSGANLLTGIHEVADDIDFRFGTDADWAINYDESVDNQLLFITANTAAVATTDPMFQILVGTTPTADQDVFGVAKGTQATNTDLMVVDEDGDLDILGNFTLGGTVDGVDIAARDHASSWTDADPMRQSTTTRDAIVGDNVGALVGKVEIGGDEDQPQLVVQGHSTQTDDIVIILNDAGAEQFAFSNTGNFALLGTVDGKDIDANAAMLNEAETIASNWVNTANPWADNEVADDITINLATLATTLTITDNEATPETNAIIFTAGGDLDGGNLGLESDGDLTYTPNTGNLSSTQIGGITEANLVDKSASETMTGNWIFNGNLSIGNAATSSGVLTILEDTDAGTNFASFQVPALASNTAYILPPAFGTAGFQLTDAAGDGVLSWAAVGSGTGAFSDAGDPVVLNTITKDVHMGDGAGTLVSKVEIGGDADQPQLVIEGFSTQTDDIFIIQNDADTEVFSVGNTGNVVVAGTVDGVDIATRDALPESKSFVIISPVATDDYPLWEAPYDYTITAIHILVVGGTNVVGGLDEADSNGLNPVAIDADLTGVAGTASDDDGSLTNPTVDDGDYLFWHTTSISGTPTSLTVTIEFTID